MTTRRQFAQASLGCGLLAALGVPSAVRAQPVEQARILYGFPAGSSGDIVARRVAERIAGSGYTRNAALVENRPGAGGRIALDALRVSPADGSTIGLSPFSCTAIYPHVYAKLP